MEELYWTHVEYFPMHFQLGAGVESRLRGLLAHAALGLPQRPFSWPVALPCHNTDTATSDDSTAPYTMEQCRDFERILAGTTGMYFNGKDLRASPTCSLRRS